MEHVDGALPHASSFETNLACKHDPISKSTDKFKLCAISVHVQSRGILYFAFEGRSLQLAYYCSENVLPSSTLVRMKEPFVLFC